MNEQQVYEIIKEELKHTVVFQLYRGDLARRITNKIKLYIKEQTYLERENRLKRVIIYRIASISSEYLIVYLVTGSLLIPIVTTPICVIVHSILHWCIDKMID